jgi:hypothetical protein
MTASLPPFVDLFEGVRVVVRLMPNGDKLACKITNDWIMLGIGRFDAPDDDPDDYMVRVYGPDWQSEPDGESVRRRVIAAYDDAVGRMVRLYGPDWRSTQPSVIAAYRKTERLLHEILPTGCVEGYGASDDAPGAIRKIGLHEWSSLRLNINHGILEGVEFPSIRRVRINRENLTSEATVRLCPPKWGSNEHKRWAVDGAIQELGVPRLAAMALGERELTVIHRVTERHNGLKVSDRYVRTLWALAKEQVSGYSFLNVPNAP